MLRRAIAERYTERGMPTDPEQLMITVGAQSAIHLLARTLLGRIALDDTLTSVDAGHANHDTARTIVGSGGDYLIQLKGNAPAVRAAADHALAGAPPFFARTTAPTAAPNTAS